MEPERPLLPAVPDVQAAAVKVTSASATDTLIANGVVKSDLTAAHLEASPSARMHLAEAALASAYDRPFEAVAETNELLLS